MSKPPSLVQHPFASLIQSLRKRFERFAFLFSHPPTFPVTFRKALTCTIPFSPFPKQCHNYILNKRTKNLKEIKTTYYHQHKPIITPDSKRGMEKQLSIFKQMQFTYLNLQPHFGHKITFSGSPFPLGNILPVEYS